MESTFGDATQEQHNTGSLDVRNIDNDQQPATPSPSSIANYRGPPHVNQPQRMDGLTDLHALPKRAHGRVFVALPDVFDRRKENYHQFRRQFRLFLTVNWEEFKEKESMIWFTLSYMKGGAAELWANAYVDNALETNNWGTWEEFLDRLAQDFGNKEEPWKALEELGRLQQGKKSAAEYFLKFEQLVSIAGIDVNRYPNTIQYIKRNVQHALIDQIYQ
jgi:hypothetical protein